MEGKEEKYLALVFGVVIFVILLIIVLALINTSTAFSDANYDIPTTVNKSTTKKVLRTEEMVSYNASLNEKSFLLAINNVIRGKISYNGDDLLKDNESKFLFIYSYYKSKDNFDSLNLNGLQNYAMLIFNTRLDSNEINAYYSNDSYYYEIDNNIQYILKVNDVRNVGDLVYIDVDLLGAGDEYDDYKVTRYPDSSVIKMGTLIAINIDGKLYLRSFALQDREDEI